MSKLGHKFRRWVFVLRNFKNYPSELNRRAAVENELINMASGKLPLPDSIKCREMATKLGTPDWWHNQRG